MHIYACIFVDILFSKFGLASENASKALGCRLHVCVCVSVS